MTHSEQLPDPFQPKIARVGQSAGLELSSLMHEYPRILEDTVERLIGEQPVMGNIIMFNVLADARDDKERRHMLKVASMMYLLFEAQHDVDNSDYPYKA